MRRTVHRVAGAVLAVLACALAAGVLMGNGAPPPLPVIYHGWVQVGDGLAPDGLIVFARVDGYESGRVTVAGGEYKGLKIAPPGPGYTGKQLSFYATLGVDEVQAHETVVYQPASAADPESWTPKLDLYFDRLPVPLPTPTPTPTPTLTPTPTVTPTPTAALPIPGDPTVGAASLWVLVIGVVGLLAGFAALRLVRTSAS